MIRVLLAVVVTAAIAGLALPAAERGETARANTLLRGEVTALASTMEAFAARNDAVAPGTAGATRRVTLRVPHTRWGAPPPTVYVGGVPGRSAPLRSDLLGWRVGTRTRLVQVGVPVAVVRDGRPVAAPLVLRTPGTHRLRLRLVRHGGRPVVTVRRFMTRNGTTPAHVRTHGR